MTTTPRPGLATIAGLALRDCSPAALAERLVPILREVPFPARRWQILTAGDLYGCDGVTRELLARVPEADYATVPDVVEALSAVLTGRPVPASTRYAAPRVPVAARLPSGLKAAAITPAWWARGAPSGSPVAAFQNRDVPDSSRLPVRRV